MASVDDWEILDDEPQSPAVTKADTEWVEVPPEPMSLGGNLMHGLVEGATDNLSVLGAIADWVKGPDWSPQAVEAGVRAGQNPGDPNAQRASDKLQMPFGSRVANSMDVVKGAFESPSYVEQGRDFTQPAPDRSADTFGSGNLPLKRVEPTFREPATPFEKGVSGAARGAFLAPAAFAGAGPLGVAGELGLMAFGPQVSEHVIDQMTPEGEEPGIGAVMSGVGAELAMVPMAPGIAASTTRRNTPRAVNALRRARAASAAKSAPPEAMKLLGTVNDRAKRMWHGMYPGMDDVTEAPQFTLEDLYDISAYYKGKIPSDPDGNIDYAELIADLLDESLLRTPGPGGPRPSQVGERAGLLRDNFRRLEENIVRMSPTGPEWSNVIAHQDYEYIAGIRRKFSNRVRSGAGEDFVKGAQTKVKEAHRVARDAWDEIPWEGMPRIELSKLANVEREVMEGSKFQDDLVPQLIKRFTKNNKEVEYIDMEAAQNLRARLGSIIREGDQGEAGIRAIKAREMRDGLDSIIDSMLDVGPDGRNAYGQFASKSNPEAYEKWKAARKAWADYKDLTSLDVVDGGDMIKLLASKNGSRKVGATALSSLPDAKRAKKFADTDPEIAKALEESVMYHLLGPPRPNSVTGYSKRPQAVMETLDKSRDSAVEILGEAYVSDIEQLLEAALDSRPGRIGRVAFETTTATGGLTDPASRAISALRAGKLETGKRVLDSILQSFTSEADKLFLQQTVIPDRELLRDVLRLASEVDVSVFAFRMEKAIKRAQARGASLAGRAANEMQEIKEHDDLKRLNIELHRTQGRPWE